MIDNKLDIDNVAELAQVEEKISKLKSIELYESNLLHGLRPGRYETLAYIHRYLFEDIYYFGGRIRDVNISKGNFRFVPVTYLGAALDGIDKMPQGDIDSIIEKYVEMNIAHPFREGNGRSMRIWLNHMLEEELGVIIDWSVVPKDEYLQAMERSPINDLEIKVLLKSAISEEINDESLFMKGIDASYHYEGYITYRAADLKKEIKNNGGQNDEEY